MRMCWWMLAVMSGWAASNQARDNENKTKFNQLVFHIRAILRRILQMSNHKSAVDE